MRLLSRKHIKKNMAMINSSVSLIQVEWRLLAGRLFVGAFLPGAFCQGGFLSVTDVHRPIASTELAAKLKIEVAVRLIIGFILDMKFMRPFRILAFVGINVLYAVGVIVLAISPWKPLSMFLIFLTTSSSATILIQTPTITADFVDRSRIASAMALWSFFQGLGCIFGPMLGEYLAVSTGTYVTTFIVPGAGLLFGSTVFVLLNMRLMVRRPTGSRSK